MLPFASSPAWHYSKGSAVPIVTGLDVAEALGLTASTDQLDDVAAVADQIITPYLSLAPVTDYSQPLMYDGTRPKVGVDLDNPPAPVREAGIAVAIDVLQSRTAAGGQNVGFDGSPGPYRMGPALIAKVGGLLGPWLNQLSDVG